MQAILNDIYFGWQYFIIGQRNIVIYMSPFFNIIFLLSLSVLIFLNELVFPSLSHSFHIIFLSVVLAISFFINFFGSWAVDGLSLLLNGSRSCRFPAPDPVHWSTWYGFMYKKRHAYFSRFFFSTEYQENCFCMYSIN